MIGFIVSLAYLIATGLYIFALHWMNDPKTARHSVFAGVAAMLLAASAVAQNPALQGAGRTVITVLPAHPEQQGAHISIADLKVKVDGKPAGVSAFAGAADLAGATGLAGALALVPVFAADSPSATWPRMEPTETVPPC